MTKKEDYFVETFGQGLANELIEELGKKEYTKFVKLLKEQDEIIDSPKMFIKDTLNYWFETGGSIDSIEQFKESQKDLEEFLEEFSVSEEEVKLASIVSEINKILA